MAKSNLAWLGTIILKIGSCFSYQDIQDMALNMTLFKSVLAFLNINIKQYEISAFLGLGKAECEDRWHNAKYKINL